MKSYSRTAAIGEISRIFPSPGTPGEGRVGAVFPRICNDDPLSNPPPEYGSAALTAGREKETDAEGDGPESYRDTVALEWLDKWWASTPTLQISGRVEEWFTPGTSLGEDPDSGALPESGSPLSLVLGVNHSTPLQMRVTTTEYQGTGTGTGARLFAHVRGVMLAMVALLAALAIGCTGSPAHTARAPDSAPRSKVVSLTAAAVAEPAPAASPAPDSAVAPTAKPAESAWPLIAKTLEREGVLKDEVYTVTIPRDDLEVGIDGMGLPTAAGIASIFHFYRCPCGKMIVVGQFVTADYEANDVVDSLREKNAMKVAAVAPFLLYERPRLLMIRFQGEGEAVAQAKVLREALRWTGRERMAPDKIEIGK